MFTRINDAAVEAFVRFAVAVQALFAPAPAHVGALNRSVSTRARALSFFEYAILAAIVIAVGIIFRKALGGVIQGMWDNISSTWNDVRTAK